MHVYVNIDPGARAHMHTQVLFMAVCDEFSAVQRRAVFKLWREFSVEFS